MSLNYCYILETTHKVDKNLLRDSERKRLPDRPLFLGSDTTDVKTLTSQHLNDELDSQSNAWEWYKSDNQAFLPKAEPVMPQTPVFSKIPKIVYFIWCGLPHNDTFFEFKHFLSIKSAIYFLNPDVIYLYYDQHPAVDKLLYNTWLDELLDTFPFLLCKHMEFDQLCFKDNTPRLVALAQMMNKTGGTYMRSDVILTKPLVLDAAHDGHVFQAWLPDGNIALVSAQRNTFRLDPRAMVNVYQSSERLTIQCAVFDTLNTMTNAQCVQVATNTSIYPNQFWENDDTFSRMVRTLFYGKPETPKVKINAYEVVPRIAHYFWFGGGEMDFIFYLSVLSCLHVLKLNAVYIHGDQPPSGLNWAKFENESRVHWIHRSRAKTIYSKNIQHVAHEADVAGLDTMLKYGGVHCDPDLMFIKEFDPSFWRYDALAAPSQSDNAPYPNIINWGLFLARPRGQFWWMVQRSERDFQTKQWNWNSARLVYKIYERNPHLLKVDAHLQVMCWRRLCIPRWPKDRRSGLMYNRNVTEWMDTVYCFHYTDYTPPQLESVEAIMTNTGPHTKVGRTILQAAGLIPHTD